MGEQWHLRAGFCGQTASESDVFEQLYGGDSAHTVLRFSGWPGTPQVLAPPFDMAGASTVIASRWGVDDQVTSELIL